MRNRTREEITCGRGKVYHTIYGQRGIRGNIRNGNRLPKRKVSRIERKGITSTVP
jgi:hypothetical protein